VAQRLAVVGATDLLAAHVVAILIGAHRSATCRPFAQQPERFAGDLLQGFLAEAHFLRSLGYFYLVRIFKDVPLVLEPSINDQADFYIPKTEGQAILARIVNDLKAYRGFAPDDSFATLEENKGRASKAAFDALLADIALWEFRYEECLEHISSIEASRQHLLLPGILWFELFSPGSSVESIFEFQFDNSRGQNNSMFDLTNEYSHQYDPGNRAVDLLNTAYTGENVRGEGGSIKIISEDDFIIWKYVGLLPDSRTVRSGSDEKSCNWIVYRYAEILLMKAEALSQLGRFEEALESINKIRSRALMPGLSMPGSRADFEDAILEERMLELAFEGKRWFDLMRMGRRDGFRRKDRLINIIVSSVPSDQKKYMALKLTDPMGWYLPVYDEELERNRALVQNPYYQY